MKTVGQLNDLSRIILDSSISVHKELGPGLLESVYHECLTEEFAMRGVSFTSLVTLPLVYKVRTLKRVMSSTCLSTTRSSLAKGRRRYFACT